jgi:tetratricopeptide (TPR) repeat protein
LDSFDNALRLKPGFAEGWHNRGSVLLDLKDHSGALASYDNALAIRPGYVEALKSRGVLLNLLQLYPEAVAAFDGALALRRDDADAWQGRANALSRLGRNEEALASYDEALLLRADDQDALSTAPLPCRCSSGSSCARLRTPLALNPDYPYARSRCARRAAIGAETTRVRSQRNAPGQDHSPFGHRQSVTQEQMQAAQILAHTPQIARHCGGRTLLMTRSASLISPPILCACHRVLMAGVFEHHDREHFEPLRSLSGPTMKATCGRD